MLSGKTPTKYIFLLLFILASFSASAYTFTANVATGNWSTAGTWTRTGTGSGNTTPGAADLVVIGAGRDITVTANASCATLQIDAANGNTSLIINTGVTLNVAAIDMNDSGNSNRDGFITINGTGVLTVSGNIDMAATEAINYITFAAAGTLNIGGNFTGTNGGGLTPSATSTINFNSTTVQQTFPNSVVNLSANNYDIDVNNTFVTGANNDGNDGFKLSAALTMDAVEVGNVNAAAIFDENTFGTFSGNFVMTGATSRLIVRKASLAAWNSGDSFVAGSTIEYINTTAQTINFGTITFRNLILSGSGDKTFDRNAAGSLQIDGNLTFNQSGSVAYTDVNAIDINGNFEGTASINSGANPITISGNWTNSATGTINGNVTYDAATATQIVDGDITYGGTLTFSGTGVKTVTRAATGTFSVTGTWTANSPIAYTNVDLIDLAGNYAGANFINSAAITVNIGGNWTNTGTGTLTGTVNYDAATATQVVDADITYGTLNFTGTGVKTVTRASNGTFAVTTAWSANSPVAYSNINLIDLGGNFTGANFINSAAIAVNIGGNWTNTGTGTLTGTVTYDAATATQVVGGDITYNNLTFSGTGVKTITRASSGTVSITGNWVLGAPVAYTNVNLISVTGNITGASFINSGAIPVNIAGSWDNTGVGTITGLVTYDGGASAQNVSANIRYDGGVTFEGAGAKTIIRNASGPFDVRGVFTQNSPIASYSGNVSFLDFDGDYNGNQFINSGSLLIYMLRDWNNTANGILTGQVRYDKIGGTQVVSGNVQYHNLNIEAGGTKIINAVEAKVTGTVSITGNTTFNTNNNLTLVQTASTMASIAAIPAGSSITGNVNVEIYLSGGADSRGTRMMTSPINDAALADKTYKQLKNHILITGSTGTVGGFDEGGTVQPFAKTLQLYNEPGAPTPASASFSDIADITTPATVGEAFFVFFRGDRTTSVTDKLNGPVFPTPESVTVRFTGPVNTGQIVKNLSYTNHSNAKDGYNAVGNPYPSPITWESVTKTANVSDVITVIRRGGLGAATYDRGTNTSVNGGSEFLQPGQGFYVQASATGQSITFEETHKVSTAPPSRLLSTPASERVLGGGLIGDNVLMDSPPDSFTPPSFKRVRISLEDAVNKDETAILFVPGGQKKSVLEDGQYFQGSSVILSSLSSDGVTMAINKFPEINRADTVKLNVNSPANNSVRLNFTEFLGLENFRITLIDKYLNITKDVVASPLYSFTIDRSIAATFGSNRFELIFEAPSVDISSFTAEQVAQAAKLNWTTAREFQSVKFEIEHSRDGATFTKIGELSGAGTVSQASNYTFTHPGPEFGINYYRFRQFDASNRVLISPVLQLTFEPPAAVVYASFTGQKEGNTSKLFWATSSEYLSLRFNIERSADGVTYTKIGEIAGAGTSNSVRNYTFTDTSPAYGTNYYRLVNENTGQQNLQSGVVQLSFEAPPAVTFASFTGQKDGSKTQLNWSTSNEYQSLRFEIERSGDGSNYTIIGQVNGAGTSAGLKNYTFTDAAPIYGMNYYRLKLVNVSNQATSSETVQVAHNLPGGVVLGTFAGQIQANTSVLLWDTSYEFESLYFELQRSVNGTDYSSLGQISAAGSSTETRNYTFTDANPAGGDNYYRLIIMDANGQSVASNVVKLNFNNPPGMVLGSFTGKKIDQAIWLDWSTLNEYQTDRFDIERSTDGINFETLTQLQGTGSSTQVKNYSVSDPNPLYGFNYYRLKHFTVNNEVTSSQIVKVDFPAPPAIILSAFTGAKTGSTITLNWATSSEYESDKFIVRHSADGLNFSDVGQIAGSGTTDDASVYSFVHVNPVYEMNYYRLDHYDTFGKVIRSQVIQVNFPPPPAMVLLGFSGKKVNGTSELSWVTSSEYQSVRFDVERSTDGINYTVQGSLTGSGTTTQPRSYLYTDKSPQFGINHYRLKHYDSKGQVLLSNGVQLSFEAPSGGIVQEVKVYPNPVTETLNASFDNPSGSNLIVSIIDIQNGKKQHTETLAPTNTVSQDVKDLRPGIYMLEIKEALSGKILVREKFIKN